MSGVATGLSDFVRGARHVASTPSLYKWVMLPFVLSLLVLAAVVWGVWTLAEPGAQAVADLLPGFIASLVGGALKVALVIVLGLGAYVLFFAVAALLTAPFCEMLSEAMEEKLSGRPSPSFSIVSFARELGRGIGHALRRVVLYLVSILAIFAAGAIVPVAGPIVATVLTAIVTIRFAAFDAMDAVMARKEWSYRQKKAFLRTHWGRSFGLGAAVAGLVLVPVLGAVALPLGAAGATLMYLDVDGSQRLVDERR